MASLSHIAVSGAWRHLDSLTTIGQIGLFWSRRYARKLRRSHHAFARLEIAHAKLSGQSVTPLTFWSVNLELQFLVITLTPGNLPGNRFVRGALRARFQGGDSVSALVPIEEA